MTEPEQGALPSAEWIPIRLYSKDSRFFVDWCHLRGMRLTEPFYDQSIERCLRHPFSLLFRPQTPVERLVEPRALQGSLAPRGFIFHLSRCGSTLVSQMLAALPRNVVLSEAGPIDSVLRAHLHVPGVTDSQRIEWLRGMVAALGRQRHAEEQHLFIKFDAWHVLELPLLQRAFPGVPWIFLYRDPVEIMASHQGHKGAHMLPGVLEPSLLGLEPEQVKAMALEEYGARVLAHLCETALKAWRERVSPALLVHYQQLPEIVLDTLPTHWGVGFTAEELDLMREAARLDAKNPVLPFADDTAAKQRALKSPAREQVERWVRPLYEALEAVRNEALGPASS
ncbi:sulfotransferase [Hyalangium versicolor]|uniref:sulfotransferase n=1 Tax=Hyalangium versicolor TaxID=2861190 RepID=UPI001CCC90B6|nr:sulfotransferase [Hyalangium versicolor]